MTESFLGRIRAKQAAEAAQATPTDRFDTPRHIGTNSGGVGYAQTALYREVERVRTAINGTRNQTLNRAAFSLGSLVSGGELHQHEVVTALTDAARSVGLDEAEIGPTIASGLNNGAMNPRTAPRELKLRGTYPTIELATEEWDEGEPFERVVKIQPFPLPTLLEIAGPFVKALSADTQTPIELPAMMALSAISVAAAGRAWVHGGGNWYEPSILWTITALDPGSRKTPVADAVRRVFYRLEKQLRDEHKAQHAGKESLLDVAKTRRTHLATKLGKTESSVERGNLTLELLTTEQEITDLSVPPPHEYLISDFTPEALAVVLSENQGVIGVLDDEGGVFGNITGRYTNGTPQLELVLKGYDGDGVYKQVRVGRGRVGIPAPAIAMGLAIQPAVLRDTTRTPALKERGLMGRFAYCVPTDTVGSRDLDQAIPMPTGIAESWEQAIEKILQMPLCQPGEPRTIIALSADAQDRFKDHRRTLEPRLHADTGDLAFMRDWASKHSGRILRIAGLLHLINGHSADSQISDRTMAAALQIGEWMLGHAINVYGGWRSAGRADMEGPLAVVKWLRNTNGAQPFTVRDFHRACSGQNWVNTESVRNALVKLIEMGWLRSVEQYFENDKRQRKTGLFVPHPQLLGGGS